MHPQAAHALCSDQVSGIVRCAYLSSGHTLDFGNKSMCASKENSLKYFAWTKLFRSIARVWNKYLYSVIYYTKNILSKQFSSWRWKCQSFAFSQNWDSIHLLQYNNWRSDKLILSKSDQSVGRNVFYLFLISTKWKK